MNHCARSIRKLSVAFAITMLCMGAGGIGGVPPVKITMDIAGRESGFGTIWIKSLKVFRMERTEKTTGKTSTVLADGKEMFLFNDKDKSGFKGPIHRAPTVRSLFTDAPFDPTDPQGALGSLRTSGFKKRGASKLGRISCDIYKGQSKAGQEMTNDTVWLRQKDLWPIKVDRKGKDLHYTVSFDWGVKIPDSVFKPPAGYIIRDFTRMTAPRKAGP